MLGRPMQSLSDEISALAKDQVMSPTALSAGTTSGTMIPSLSIGFENKGELGARCEALILKHRKRRRRIGLVSERIISVSFFFYVFRAVFYFLNFPKQYSHEPMKNVSN